MKKFLLLLFLFIPYLNCMEHEEEKPRQAEHIDISIEEKGEECPICLESMERGDVRILPCSHKFHTVCINTWELRHQQEFTCPYCRALSPRILPHRAQVVPFPAPHHLAPVAEADPHCCLSWFKTLKEKIKEASTESLYHPRINGNTRCEKYCTYGCSNCCKKTAACSWNCSAFTGCTTWYCLCSDYGIYCPRCCLEEMCWDPQKETCCCDCDEGARICLRGNTFCPGIFLFASLMAYSCSHCHD